MSGLRLPALPIVVGVLLAVTACTPSPAATESPGTTGSASPAAASGSPPASRPAGSAPASATPSGAPAATDAPSTYTVQPGDTLFSIGQRFGVTVEQLQAWNADRYPSLVDDPATLQIDWVLVVAGDASVPPPPTAGESPVAATEPPPVALDCSAGNRVTAGDQQVFSTIPGAGPGVALTFDMGGRIEPAVEIMNFLVANGVCATIFPTGVMSQTAEGQAVMGIIRDHPELFEVGNHTMYHCNLRDGGGGSPNADPCPLGRPSTGFIQGELDNAAAILREATGQEPIPYWRPPYGAYDQGVLDAAAAAGYTKTFMWDIDTVDWKPVSEGGPSAEQIASRVVNSAVNGSNVLMHLGGWNTLDALPSMVSGLRDRGFVLTSLSDLLQ